MVGIQVSGGDSPGAKLSERSANLLGARTVADAERRILASPVSKPDLLPDWEADTLKDSKKRLRVLNNIATWVQEAIGLYAGEQNAQDILAEISRQLYTLRASGQFTPPAGAPAPSVGSDPEYFPFEEIIEYF